MKIKLTGEIGDRVRTVIVKDAYQIPGQTAYAGKWPNGSWVRITTNIAFGGRGKGRILLKDFTEVEFID